MLFPSLSPCSTYCQVVYAAPVSQILRRRICINVRELLELEVRFVSNTQLVATTKSKHLEAKYRVHNDA